MGSAFELVDGAASEPQADQGNSQYYLQYDIY